MPAPRHELTNSQGKNHIQTTTYKHSIFKCLNLLYTAYPHCNNIFVQLHYGLYITCQHPESSPLADDLADVTFLLQEAWQKDLIAGDPAHYLLGGVGYRRKSESGIYTHALNAWITYG